MAHSLDRMTIVVSESRELDLFTNLLEAEGAAVVRCPLVTILDVDDFTEIDGWIGDVVGRPLDDLVLYTGEGLRRLLRRSKGLGVRDKFISALARARTIIRGPKPARALREIGLSPTIAAPSPTSAGLLATIAKEDLRSHRVGVQLYPGAADLVVNALRQKGAEVKAVTPYRYASETETAAVAQIIKRMAAGAIDMMAFTSSPQVERLKQVARESGLEEELAEGIRRVRIAAIGPVVQDALKLLGAYDVILPANDAFHLKPLVRAISSAWDTRRHN